jgi:ubiquinol-cytochrome c reductase cytochrome c1 subunit
MKFVKTIAIALTAAAGFAATAWGAGAAKHPIQQEWSFEGPFGTFDQASAQRGWQVYREVCSACHSLKYFHFRNLADLGYEEDMIKAWAAEYTVVDGVDDAGDPKERKGLPQDMFPSPFPNPEAAMAANGGALPPDLSLIAKARHDGPNYVYSLLTGYEDAPADHPVPAGKSYNPYFKGGAISMAPPLAEGIIEYEDGTAGTQEQMAKDIVNFLMYVAEPKLVDRHHMGFNVLFFLAVLTVILYLSMKKIWKPVKAGKNFYEDA